MPKNAENFYCDACNFVCSKKSNYDAHHSTRKHKMITQGLQKNATAFRCGCGKVFNYRQNLFRHKKSCDGVFEEDESADNSKMTAMGELLKQHEEIKHFLLDQMRENNEFKNLLLEQNSKILELSKANVVVNHTTNNQFNINVFLNDKCKDAINMTDFVEDLKIDFKDLENVGSRGYVEGITKIFMKGLNELNLYERPIHCTDMKREILYIKDENRWTKDEPDQSKIKTAIKKIAFKNFQQVGQWSKMHPEINNLDSEEFHMAFNIMQQSMGGPSGTDIDKKNEKVVKNIIKSVYISPMEKKNEV